MCNFVYFSDCYCNTNSESLFTLLSPHKVLKIPNYTLHGHKIAITRIAFFVFMLCVFQRRTSVPSRTMAAVSRDVSIPWEASSVAAIQATN